MTHSDTPGSTQKVYAVGDMVPAGTARSFAGYIRYIGREIAADMPQMETFCSGAAITPAPGRSPVLSTAVFTGERDALVPEEHRQLLGVFHRAQIAGSPMWRPILTFPLSWLQEQELYDPQRGLYNHAAILSMTRRGMRELLKLEQMTSSAVWCAAVHYNTAAVHVHIAVCDPVGGGKEREFQKVSLSRMASCASDPARRCRQASRRLLAGMREAYREGAGPPVPQKIRRLLMEYDRTAHGQPYSGVREQALQQKELEIARCFLVMTGRQHIGKRELFLLEPQLQRAVRQAYHESLPVLERERRRERQKSGQGSRKYEQERRRQVVLEGSFPETFCRRLEEKTCRLTGRRERERLPEKTGRDPGRRSR